MQLLEHLRARRGTRTWPAMALLGVMVAVLAPSSLAAKGRPPGALARSAPLTGVNIVGLDSSSSNPGFAIAQAHALHAQLVRVAVSWALIEPNKGELSPGSLGAIDRIFSAAQANGVKVILTLEASPCWASSAPASILGGCVPGRLTPANAWPPTDPGDYAAMAGFLAKRYGAQLEAIEVWNEPDHSNQNYFAGPEKPKRYAAILRAAYPAIKAADPQVLVLGGSLVGSNGVFLRELYKAGIKGFYDGLAVHYYNLVLGSVRAIHEVQVANHDTKPLWLDEFGWTSCYPKANVQEEQACVDTQTQSANLADVYRSLRRTPYVAAEVMYDLQNSHTEDFGVLNIDGTRKPAFAALAKIFSSPFGNPRPVVLRLARKNGRIVASGSGPVGDYMELEAFSGTRLRYRSLFILDRFNRYSLKLPRVLGTHGLKIRVYQYWAGLGKAAQRSI
jgi:hypothetical protein